MSQFDLSPDVFVMPTAGGAYHSICTRDPGASRDLVLALLRHEVSPRASVEQICSWVGVPDEQRALAVVHRAQALGWIQGHEQPQTLGDRGVGRELQHLLPALSSVGQSLLVDRNGLPLASTGMDGDLAETLAALSADLIAVQERHAPRLTRHLGTASHGWAAVDAYGSSRIGAWPLYIGEAPLMLVLLGEPRLNLPQFLSMAWLLMNRYG